MVSHVESTCNTCTTQGVTFPRVVLPAEVIDGFFYEIMSLGENYLFFFSQSHSKISVGFTIVKFSISN